MLWWYCGTDRKNWGLGEQWPMGATDHATRRLWHHHQGRWRCIPGSIVECWGETSRLGCPDSVCLQDHGCPPPYIQWNQSCQVEFGSWCSLERNLASSPLFWLAKSFTPSPSCGLSRHTISQDTLHCPPLQVDHQCKGMHVSFCQ